MRNSQISLLSLSREDVSLGVASVENEYVFFAYTSDLQSVVSELSKTATSIEYQEQYGIDIQTPEKSKTQDAWRKTTLRIRKTIPVSGFPDTKKLKNKKEATYEQAIKVPLPSDHGGVKSKEISTQSCHDAFLVIQEIATMGMCKIRYTLPSEFPGRFYEYDLMINKEGDPLGFFKIDLEIPNKLPSAPKLVEGFDRVVYHQRSDRTSEENEFIDKYWKSACRII
jgi:hypothetical protein